MSLVFKRWLAWIIMRSFSLLGGISLALLLPSFCMALDSSDKGKPLHIISDSSSYNHKTGINIFEGHVQVDQGETHLTGDQLVTKRNNNQKIQEAIAYGFSQLAHYWTTPQIGEKPLHAKAKIIRFYPPQSLVVLEKEVEVTQGGNSFKGPIIIYNMKSQNIIVPPSQQGHATIVYDPETKSLP